MVIYGRTRHARALVLVAATLLPAPGGAAEPLALADALARARAQAHEPLAAAARRRAAEERRRSAAASRLPSLRLSESWIRTDSPADAFALLLNQERFSFPEFVAGDPNDPDPLDTGISRIELELPIYTAGEISTRIEQAELAAGAAGDAASRATDAAAVAAGSAWLDLARARESVALLERSRATVAAHLDAARDRAAQGMIVRSEELRAAVELARIADLLAAARLGAEVAEAALAFQLGDPPGSRYELPPLAAVAGGPAPLEDWLASGAQRADLAAAGKRVKAGELEARAISAGRGPRIGLVARQDWTDDEPFGDHGSSTTVIAAASFELFDGGRRRAAAAAASAEAEAARIEVESLAAAVGLEIRSAHAEARTALERQATARAALESAAEALRIVEERFRAGVLGTLDVLDAATARREAETRELLARADARGALLRLALAAGRAPETALADTAEAADPAPGDRP